MQEPTGNGARIVWESSFTPLDQGASEELSRLWEGMLLTVLGDLRTVIEQR